MILLKEENEAVHFMNQENHKQNDLSEKIYAAVRLIPRGKVASKNAA